MTDRKVPTKPGDWLRCINGQYEYPVEVRFDPPSLLVYQCGGMEDDQIVNDDGCWLCEIPSAAELRRMQERIEALEGALFAYKEFRTVCGMNCENLPHEVREQMHKLPDIEKMHSCAMLAAAQKASGG